jgi:hypothetical protein
MPVETSIALNTPSSAYRSRLRAAAVKLPGNELRMFGSAPFGALIAAGRRVVAPPSSLEGD